MSRSYKKEPWCCENSHRKPKRVLANRIVRSKLKQNPDNYFSKKGNSYRKISESYDICDYRWTSTWEEYWAREVNYCNRYGIKLPDFKEGYRNWLKYYRMK